MYAHVIMPCLPVPSCLPYVTRLFAQTRLRVIVDDKFFRERDLVFVEIAKGSEIFSNISDVLGVNERKV